MKNPLVRSSLKQAAGPAILYVTWSIETVAPVGGLKVRKKNLKVRTKLPKNMAKIGVSFMLSNKFFWWILCDFRIFSIYVWHFFLMEFPHHLEISFGEDFQKESNIPDQNARSKIIDSKVPNDREYVGSQWGYMFVYFLGTERHCPRYES